MKAKKKIQKKAVVKKTKPSAKGSVTTALEKTHGRTFSESDVISILNDELNEAWKKLRAFAAKLGPQRIYASTQSIMFARKNLYFYVTPKKTSIEVWIFLPRKIDGLLHMQSPGKKEKYGNKFKLTHADQVEEPLTDWLRDAWEFSPE